MNLRTSVKPIHGLFHAQVGLNSPYGCGLTAREEEALAAFGPLVVDAGGEFSGSEGGTTWEFALPENDRTFPLQFPVSESFEEGAEARIFVATLSQRIQAGLAELCARDPGPVGISVIALGTHGAVSEQLDGDESALFLQATGTSQYF